MPEPGANAVDELWWQAVDQHGADSHRFEPARGEPEAVTVFENRLAGNPNDLADRPPVGDPEWNTSVEKHLIIGKLQILGDLFLDLHQDEIRLVIAIGSGEQLGQRFQIPLHIERDIGACIVLCLLLLLGRPVHRPAGKGNGDVIAASARCALAHQGDRVERHLFPGVFGQGEPAVLERGPDPV